MLFGFRQMITGALRFSEQHSGRSDAAVLFNKIAVEAEKGFRNMNERTWTSNCARTDTPVPEELLHFPQSRAEWGLWAL